MPGLFMGPELGLCTSDEIALLDTHRRVLEQTVHQLDRKEERLTSHKILNDILKAKADAHGKKIPVEFQAYVNGNTRITFCGHTKLELQEQWVPKPEPGNQQNFGGPEWFSGKKCKLLLGCSEGCPYFQTFIPYNMEAACAGNL